jgi:hypothetical protein
MRETMNSESHQEEEKKPANPERKEASSEASEPSGEHLEGSLEKRELRPIENDVELSRKFGAPTTTRDGVIYLEGHVSNVPEITRGVQSPGELKELFVVVGGAFVQMGKEALEQTGSALACAVDYYGARGVDQIAADVRTTASAAKESLSGLGSALNCAAEYYRTRGMPQIAEDIGTASRPILNGLVEQLGRPLSIKEQGTQIANVSTYFLPGGMPPIAKADVAAMRLETLGEKELRQAGIGKITVTAVSEKGEEAVAKAGQIGGREAPPFGGPPNLERALGERDRRRLFDVVLAERGFDNSIGVGQLETGARSRIEHLKPMVEHFAGKADGELTRGELGLRTELNGLERFVAGELSIDSAEARIQRLQTRIAEFKNGATEITPRETNQVIDMNKRILQRLESRFTTLYGGAGDAGRLQTIGELRTRTTELEQLQKAGVKVEASPQEINRLVRAQTTEMKTTERKLAVSNIGEGGPLGLGINTYAMVRIVEPNGRSLQSIGRFERGFHAEENAIRNLKADIVKNGVSVKPGSHIEVIGDQTVCGKGGPCRPALEEFAALIGADRVEGYTYHREFVEGGKHASAKTTIVTITERAPQEKIRQRTGRDPALFEHHEQIWSRNPQK